MVIMNEVFESANSEELRKKLLMVEAPFMNGL
jgi:hypothetical protein